MKDIIYVTRSRKSKKADNTMVKEKYKKHKQGSTNTVHKNRRCTWVLWKSNLPLRPYSKHPISLFVLFVVCGDGDSLVKIIYELCFYELLLCPLRFQDDKMYLVVWKANCVSKMPLIKWTRSWRKFHECVKTWDVVYFVFLCILELFLLCCIFCFSVVS